jgi:ADP-heptose:LPS heptosyltransferase
VTDTPASPDPSPAPRSVAVFRALALGDMVCAVPALRALRAAWPEAHVALVGFDASAAITDRFPELVDEWIEFPGHPALPERPAPHAAFAAFADAMRARRFDLAVQLHGDGRVTDAIVAAFGARRAVLAAPPAAIEPADVRGVIVAPYPTDAHEVRRCLAVVAAAGAPSRGEALAFPIRAADREALPRDLPTSFAIVHPGSSTPARRWPAERFAQIADALVERGLGVALTGLPSERAVADAVLATAAGSTRPRTRDLTGRTDLGALAALVDRAALVVANDTGIAHLAAARRTPSVIVFSGSDPARWAALDRRLHRALGDPAAGRVPSVAEVVAAVDDALAAHAVRAA